MPKIELEEHEDTSTGETIIQTAGLPPEPMQTVEGEDGKPMSVGLVSVGHLVKQHVDHALTPHIEKFEKMYEDHKEELEFSKDMLDTMIWIKNFLTHKFWSYLRFGIAMFGTAGVTFIIVT